MTVVTSIDRSKAVRTRGEIELFESACVLSLCFFNLPFV